MLILLFCASNVYAGTTTLFLRAHERTPRWARTYGSFGAEYVAGKRLQLVTSFETELSTWSTGQIRLDNTYYHLGFRFAVKDGVTVELKHGSQHVFDKPGLGEHYNRVGLEVRL